MELTVNNLQLAPEYWIESTVWRRSTSRSWWLPGAVLALYLWSLPSGFELPMPESRSLRIDLQWLPRNIAQPESAPEVKQSVAPDSTPAEPAMGAPATNSPTRPHTAVDQTAPLNLRARASELVSQWQGTQADQTGSADYPVTGVVFDNALRARLEAIAPVKSAVAESGPAMANALGETQLIIGDQCVITQDLDDQALRGMKLWWVGLCDTRAKKSTKLRLP